LPEFVHFIAGDDSAMVMERKYRSKFVEAIYMIAAESAQTPDFKPSTYGLAVAIK
jgi:hypothetical protein